MMERRREINADQNQKKKVFIYFRDRNFFTKRKMIMKCLRIIEKRNPNQNSKSQKSTHYI